MKIFVCVLMLIAAVYAKKELQVKNYCNKYTIIGIDSVWDEKTSGPIDGNSIVNVKYSTHEETEEHGNFDITFNFQVSKYVVFGYVPLPQAVHDQVGKALDKGFPNVQYLGKSTVRANCMFKILPSAKGQCMPPKGTVTERLVLEPIMKEVKKALGAAAFLINGWFRIYVAGRTSFGTNAFCVSVEANLQVN